MNDKQALVIGGSAGTGLAVARALAKRGERVTLTSRDAGTAQRVAAELGHHHQGIALDLTRPDTFQAALAGLTRVDHLVIAAVERDRNSVRDYDADAATRAITLKVVGYTGVVATLANRLAPDGAIVLFGGVAHTRPYPGSTTITQANGAVRGLVRTLAVELSPVRVNAVHPGGIADSPEVTGTPGLADRILARTAGPRVATMADVADATLFLLDNGGVNAVDLRVDGGFARA